MIGRLSQVDDVRAAARIAMADGLAGFHGGGPVVVVSDFDDEGLAAAAIGWNAGSITSAAPASTCASPGNCGQGGIVRTLSPGCTAMIKAGDKVKWGTSGGETHGVVEKKVTSETKIKGHVAKPTNENPQFVVKSDKSGKHAVHKPDDLMKI